jgi:hypothetical protein
LDKKKVRELTIKLVEDSKKTANPGFPLCADFKDIWAAWETSSDSIIELVWQRLNLYLNTDHDDVKGADPRDLVLQNYTDLVRIMIKDEPHSEEKIVNKRFRVIYNVSLPNVLVEKILNSTLTSAEMASYNTIPAKVGCPLGTVNGDRVVFEWLNKADDKPGATIGSDAEGWDAQFQRFFHYLNAEFTAGQLDGPEHQRMAIRRMLFNRAECMIKHLLVAPDGTIVLPLDEYQGGQDSGTYTTTPANNRMRAFSSWYLAPDKTGWSCITMGDDCVERTTLDPNDFVSSYQQVLGIKLKKPELDVENVEFCSRVFERKTGNTRLNSPWKVLWRHGQSKQLGKTVKKASLDALIGDTVVIRQLYRDLIGCDPKLVQDFTNALCHVRPQWADYYEKYAVEFEHGLIVRPRGPAPPQ